MVNAKKARAGSASGSADTAQDSQGNKYSHRLASFWFLEGQPEHVQGLLAASVAQSTAELYTRHVKDWLVFCNGMELSPLRAGTPHILEFLSRIALQSGANSAKMAEAALRKFNSINMVDPACSDSPAIRTLLTGASNLAPGAGRHKNHRLAFNMEALKIASLVIRQKDWSKEDKNIFWAVLLVTYWGSIRVGDITSGRVNSITAKCLTWNNVKVVNGNKLSVPSLKLSCQELGPPRNRFFNSPLAN